MLDARLHIWTEAQVALFREQGEAGPTLHEKTPEVREIPQRRNVWVARAHRRQGRYTLVHSAPVLFPYLLHRACNATRAGSSRILHSLHRLPMNAEHDLTGRRRNETV